jgi:hypothetical protein
MLTRFASVALFVVACRDTSDPGFEIVKVPLSAYAAADASVAGEGGALARDGGDPIMLCVPKPEKKEDDDESEDCPSEYQGRSYDEKATTRHRAKDDESTVCCYRKGRVPRREHGEEE